MAESKKVSEKRKFFRYHYEKPVKYSIVSLPGNKNMSPRICAATSRNVSVSGILFTSEYMPELSSIVALDLDYRTSNICREIENRVAMVGDKVLGKVVRLEDNEDNSYNVGVAFITKSDNVPDGIEGLVK
jgi:hypothetical protein